MLFSVDADCTSIVSLLGMQDAMTKIRLPFRRSKDATSGAQLGPVEPSVASGMAALYDDIDQRLLLFLCKMSCLAISNAVSGRSKVMLKVTEPGSQVRASVLCRIIVKVAVNVGLNDPSKHGHCSTKSSRRSLNIIPYMNDNSRQPALMTTVCI